MGLGIIVMDKLSAEVVHRKIPHSGIGTGKPEGRLVGVIYVKQELPPDIRANVPDPITVRWRGQDREVPVRIYKAGEPKP